MSRRIFSAEHGLGNFLERLALGTGKERGPLPNTVRWSCPLMAAELLLESGDLEGARAVLSRRARTFFQTVSSRHILPLVAVLLMERKVEAALEEIAAYLGRVVSERCPQVAKVGMLLEGHVYLEQGNLTGSRAWVKGALEYLGGRFDFDVFALAVKVSTDVLQETVERAEAKVLREVAYEDEAYLAKTANPRDVQLLERVLRRKQLETAVVERHYLKRNPYTQKDTIVKYFHAHPKDKETLRYVMERRRLPMLKQLALELRVYHEVGLRKAEALPWRIAEMTAPAAGVPAGGEQASGPGQAGKPRALLEPLELEGVKLLRTQALAAGSLGPGSRGKRPRAGAGKLAEQVSEQVAKQVAKQADEQPGYPIPPAFKTHHSSELDEEWDDQ